MFLDVENLIKIKENNHLVINNYKNISSPTLIIILLYLYLILIK